MRFDKGTPPFKYGDWIRMLDEGFSIEKGTVVQAGDVRWVKGHEWCVEVHLRNHYGRPVGYRASRFEKVEEPDMRYLFAIMATEANGTPIDGTLEWMRGTREEVEEAVSRSLKIHPERKYITGRFDREGKVVSPPIKFSNI